MKEALVDYMKADAGVSALVGTRINWNTRPQSGSLPAISLQTISANRDYHMEGPSGLVTSRVQIDVWGRSFDEMETIKRAVRDALSGLQYSQSGVEIQGAFVDDEDETFEDDPAQRVHHGRFDFIVWHSDIGV